MDVNSNRYTYLFSIIMVVIVAVLLSLAATVLKPFQDANMVLEKKSNILASIGLVSENPDSLFNSVIVEQLVIRNGEVTESEVSAFDLDMAKAVKVSSNKRSVPLFVATYQDNTYYILPVRGKGLWGPIWGFISLQSDANTIYGASFNHEKETPGLGAEISTAIFQDQFPGKIIFSDSYDGIEVRKGDARTNQQVDGISGGTITSVGVQYMLEDCLIPYKAYLLKQVAESTVETHIETLADSSNTNHE